MNETRKLPDAVELVKSDIFWPEGRFYFVCGDLVCSKKKGWLKYYKVKGEECYFETEEEAMTAWESSIL